jgi:DNA-binding response OmpR family regulator
VTSVELPTLVIVASASAPAIEQLFGKRGFVTYVATDAEALAHLMTGEDRVSAAAAILDFELPDADQALNLLTRENPRRPILVGIASSDGLLIGENLLDSAFLRPVDPARLFARVVQLLADRRKGKKGAKRLTGIVAVVHGNRLFHMVERELTTAVPRVNAGAILEKVLHDLGADPSTLDKADLVMMLQSGALAQHLEGFGEPSLIDEALGKIMQLLESGSEA